MNKDMDILDIVMALEGGELIINNDDEIRVVLSVADTFKYSQGFYGRLSRAITEFLDNPDRAYPVHL